MKLARGVAPYLILSSGGRALVLLSILVGSVVWDAAKFGQFMHTMAFAQMCGTAATLGMGQGLLRLFPLLRDLDVERVFVVRFTMGFSVVAAALSGAVAFALAGLDFGAIPKSEHSTLLYLAVSLWSVSFAVSLIVQGYFVADNRSRAAGVLIAVRSVVFAAAISLGAWFGLPFDVAVIIISVLEVMVISGGAAVVLRRIGRISSVHGALKRLGKDEKIRQIRATMVNGAPGGIGDISSQLAIWISITLLASVGGPVGVAVFSVGQRLFLIGTMISRQVALVYVPSLVAYRVSADSRAFRFRARRSFSVVLGSGLFMLVPASIAAAVVSQAHEAYSANVSALVAMVLSGLIASAYAWLVSVQQSLGALRSWTVVELISSAIFIIFGAAGAAVYGVLGVSLAFLLSHVARLAMSAWLVSRAWRMSPIAVS